MIYSLQATETETTKAATKGSEGEREDGTKYKLRSENAKSSGKMQTTCWGN